MFELFGFSPLQDPFLKGITELKMTQALSKTALTCSSGLLSHPTDIEAGLGKNSAFPSPSSQGILCLHLSSPLHGGHRGGRSFSYSEKAKRDVEGSAPLGDDGQHQPWCQVQLQEEQLYTILLQGQPGAKKTVLVKACTAYPNHQGGFFGCNQRP